MPSAPSIVNPKRHLDPEVQIERRLFPYYAGFSRAFVDSTLELLNLPSGARILDPWNGSGTTTITAFNRGLTAIGSDLNPVMALVAKAAFISRFEVDSLVPLAHSIVDNIELSAEAVDDDPLANWFHPRSIALIRAVEAKINRSLVSHNCYAPMDTPEAVERATPLAAFFYLALFRITRRWAQCFFASNPTWVRTAKSTEEKIRLPRKSVSTQFVDEVKSLSAYRERFPMYGESDHDRLKILLANAEKIPLASKSIDAIITSPPYCTRIDYAVATFIELAILRVGGSKFSMLRRELTGTSTVQKQRMEIDPAWGKQCNTFLNAVWNHPSKASTGYYYKNHLEYFSSLYSSLREASRLLRKKSSCVLVVQNSYYKEIRNEVAKVIEEMAGNLAMPLIQQADFSASRSMAGVNSRAKKYVEKRSTIESVLIFQKQ